MTHSGLTPLGKVQHAVHGSGGGIASQAKGASNHSLCPTNEVFWQLCWVDEAVGVQV